jgi:hypothetical protein
LNQLALERNDLQKQLNNFTEKETPTAKTDMQHDGEFTTDMEMLVQDLALQGEHIKLKEEAKEKGEVRRASLFSLSSLRRERGKNLV